MLRDVDPRAFAEIDNVCGFTDMRYDIDTSYVSSWIMVNPLSSVPYANYTSVRYPQILAFELRDSRDSRYKWRTIS